MAKVFVVDVGRCSGCYNCQLACKDEHVDNDWRPYAAPQPETGHFWLKLDEHVCGTIPKVKIHYIARLCNHCENPACMAACPSDAITRREDGLVLIAPETCTGCGQCVDACPYGAVYFNDKLNIAQKCTGCAHLLDNGYKLPRCVEACPTDALQFGEEDDLAEALKDASPLHPETGLGPRVYYRRIPGQFIAGTVYDPVEKEVIIGGKCLLKYNEKIWETETDAYGDFWFRDLPVDTFDLTICADGFADKVFPGIRTDECRNLGDIPMERI